MQRRKSPTLKRMKRSRSLINSHFYTQTICCDTRLWGLLLFSPSIVSHSLQLHGLQYSRLPYPSLSPRVCSNSYPLNWWYHPTISSSVIPFSSCLQSFPAPGSFPMDQLFISGFQSIGALALASVLSMNIQGWFPLGLISWQSKGLSRLFSSTTV